MQQASATVVSPFGARLRRWRAYRRLSQLDLATEVGSTARHLSFLETGRSRPSRQMVLRLGEALGVS
jgi:transcriptional regulator with XRE-family HTH domain